MNTLQNIILPTSGLSVPASLYVREESTGQRFDTFFNVLNVKKIKKHCAISDLSLSASGAGDFEILILGSYTLQGDAEVLERFDFRSNQEISKIFPLSWNQYSHNFIFIEVVPRNSAKISGLAFVTHSPIVHEVRLGATIVHFNRKEWIVPALRRLKSELLDDPEYRNRIAITVVDNSQNLTSEESSGAHIIKNKNLGGSGGFTRGLLHYKDLGFSHCLFMDDDASCETESLKRTWALLSYAKTSKFAVAGSLLLEESPQYLYEKGGFFTGINKALFGGFNMAEAPDLALVENDSVSPNYGGWWFFAFRISDLARFPFPFFVRGDDLMFSLMNKFNIYTTNGIACWGDDFAAKASPLACYLDGRSIILNNIVACENGIFKTLIHLSKHFILNSFLFNYATVRAIRFSLRDTMKGPSFWKDNIDTAGIRKEIASFSQSEKMQPLNLSDYSYDEALETDHRSSRGKKRSISLGTYLKILLINGAFLPDFLMKKNHLLMPKGKYGGLKSAFRYNKIIYYDAKTSTGYVAILNRQLLMKEAFLFITLCLKVLIHGRKFREDLNKAVKLYSSESFWRSVYLKP